MTLSRWKVMAVGLGVSLGGLAAMAGQCPKNDPGKGPTPPSDIPVLPMSKAAPTAPALPDLPPPPLPATGGAIPVVPPAPDTLPSLPAPSADPAPVKKPDTPVSSPALPPIGTELPTGGSAGVVTTPPALPPMPVADLVPPLPSAPPAGLIYNKPVPRAPEPARPSVPSPVGSAPLPSLPVPGDVTPASRTTPAVGAALNAAKFRILLRVGEGEPTFEVKCGDDLVLKVICEKVDIASPEKGSGPSMVKASGKVRFAGFGAEGVCGELSFLAGTGEVKMAGDVNIKVKDKLGRVESEFSTASVTYKLDPCPTGSR